MNNKLKANVQIGLRESELSELSELKNLLNIINSKPKKAISFL